jgi:hypothetical protein
MLLRPPDPRRLTLRGGPRRHHNFSPQPLHIRVLLVHLPERGEPRFRLNRRPLQPGLKAGHGSPRVLNLHLHNAGHGPGLNSPICYHP